MMHQNAKRRQITPCGVTLNDASKSYAEIPSSQPSKNLLLAKIKPVQPTAFCYGGFSVTYSIVSMTKTNAPLNFSAHGDRVAASMSACWMKRYRLTTPREAQIKPIVITSIHVIPCQLDHTEKNTYLVGVTCRSADGHGEGFSLWSILFEDKASVSWHWTHAEAFILPYDCETSIIPLSVSHFKDSNGRGLWNCVNRTINQIIGVDHFQISLLLSAPFALVDEAVVGGGLQYQVVRLMIRSSSPASIFADVSLEKLRLQETYVNDVHDDLPENHHDSPHHGGKIHGGKIHDEMKLMTMMSVRTQTLTPEIEGPVEVKTLVMNRSGRFETVFMNLDLSTDIIIIPDQHISAMLPGLRGPSSTPATLIFHSRRFFVFADSSQQSRNMLSYTVYDDQNDDWHSIIVPINEPLDERKDGAERGVVAVCNGRLVGYNWSYDLVDGRNLERHAMGKFPLIPSHDVDIDWDDDAITLFAKVKSTSFSPAPLKALLECDFTDPTDVISDKTNLDLFLSVCDSHKYPLTYHTKLQEKTNSDAIFVLTRLMKFTNAEQIASLVRILSTTKLSTKDAQKELVHWIDAPPSEWGTGMVWLMNIDADAMSISKVVNIFQVHCNNKPYPTTTTT
eukprot:GHVH01016883.1.p1 GENE.GHVH01016883.1~~GHVH01016883.1.p1  ORF type:complete len:620 (+),score=70.95 GHVH01016883.1:942-2801(+)